jgi:hypothetical protein
MTDLVPVVFRIRKEAPLVYWTLRIVVVMTPRITMKVICVVYVMNGNLRNLETLMNLSLQNGVNVIYVAIGPILHIALLSAGDIYIF